MNTISEVLDMIARETFVIRGSNTTQIALPNGWQISVGVGPDHYCVSDGSNCEVAIFTNTGEWFAPHDEFGFGSQVWGYIDADLLQRTVDAVALQIGGCVCPTCAMAPRGWVDITS